MTPRQYCEDRVAQPGSTLYYSLLYLPAENRDAVCALFAFRDEQLALLGPSRNDDVSKTKLAWWFEEVARFSKGEPRHPVTRALKDIVSPSLSCVASELHAVLPTPHFTDHVEQQTEFAVRSGGAIALAAAQHCGYTCQSNSALIHDLGLACAMSECLKLGQHGDTHYLHHATSVLEHTFTAIEQPDRYCLLGLLTMAALNLAFLKRAARARETINPPRDLTPMAKLWIAWRTERMERKLSRKQTK